MNNHAKILLAIVILTLLANSGCINLYSAEDYFTQGKELYNQGKYREAILKFDKSLEIDSNNKEVWYFKGNALIELGKLTDPNKFNEAIKCYDNAIAIDSRYADAWFIKGLL